MARNFRDVIVEGLEGLFGSSFDSQVYEDLAWGALANTEAFVNSNLLTNSDKIRIQNFNDSEDLGINTVEPKCN